MNYLKNRISILVNMLVHVQKLLLFSKQHSMVKILVNIGAKAFILLFLFLFCACNNKKEINGLYVNIRKHPKNNIQSINIDSSKLDYGQNNEKFHICLLAYSGKTITELYSISHDTLQISSKELFAYSFEKYHKLLFRILDDNTIQCINKEYPNLYLEIYQKNFLKTSQYAKRNNYQDDCAFYFDTILNRNIYKIANSLPEFPGGDVSLEKFIRKNLKYTADTAECPNNVYVSVIIETDGSISNKKIIGDPCAGYDEEALKIIDLMPKWAPAKCKGKDVPMRINLPISFSKY